MDKLFENLPAEERVERLLDLAEDFFLDGMLLESQQIFQYAFQLRDKISGCSSVGRVPHLECGGSEVRDLSP